MFVLLTLSIWLGYASLANTSWMGLSECTKDLNVLNAQEDEEHEEEHEKEHEEAHEEEEEEDK